MWDLNTNLNVQKIQVQDTLAYVIDDFYKDPDRVARFLFSRELPLYKDQVNWAGKNLSRNGFDFETSRKVMDIEKNEYLKIINLL